MIAPFPYFGGKAQIAKWIIDHLPRRSPCLIDLFGGAGNISLLAAKTRGWRTIVYNEINGEVTEFFRVLRDRGDELREKIRLTPYSRAEYLKAVQGGLACCEVERARRFYVRMAQGFRGQGIERGSTWDITATRNDARICANRDATLETIVPLLRSIAIHNKPAANIIRELDHPDVLFYADPPYHSTASHFSHVFDESAHEALAQSLTDAKGNAAVSGYPSPLYDRLYAGWHRVERAHRSSTATSMGYAHKRTECLWIKRVLPPPSFSLKEPK